MTVLAEHYPITDVADQGLIRPELGLDAAAEEILARLDDLSYETMNDQSRVASWAWYHKIMSEDGIETGDLADRYRDPDYKVPIDAKAQTSTSAISIAADDETVVIPVIQDELLRPEVSGIGRPEISSRYRKIVDGLGSVVSVLTGGPHLKDRMRGRLPRISRVVAALGRISYFEIQE